MILSSLFFSFLFFICCPGIFASPEADAGQQMKKAQCSNMIDSN